MAHVDPDLPEAAAGGQSAAGAVGGEEQADERHDDVAELRHAGEVSRPRANGSFQDSTVRTATLDGPEAEQTRRFGCPHARRNG